MQELEESLSDDSQGSSYHERSIVTVSSRSHKSKKSRQVKKSSIYPKVNTTSGRDTSHLNPDADPFVSIQGNPGQTYDHDFVLPAERSISRTIPTQPPSPQSDTFEKLMHLRIMERRQNKFDGTPLRYISFKNEFSLLMARFPSDAHYLFNELLASLSGDALEAVSHCKDLLADPQHALQTALTVLKRDFGSDYQVRQAHLKNITNPSKKVTWDASSMRSLLSELEKCKALLDNTSQKVYLDSPDTIKAVVKRMPHKSQNRFISACVRKLKDASNPGFNFLLKFVSDELHLANNIFSDLISPNNGSGHSGKVRQDRFKKSSRTNAAEKEKQRSSSTANYAENKKEPGTGSKQSPKNGKDKPKHSPAPCRLCKAKGHRLQDCRTFLDKSVAQRWAFVNQQEKLCPGCLGNHDLSFCRTKFSCRECDKKEHHSLLHPGDTTGSSCAVVANGPALDSETKPAVTSVGASSSASSPEHPVYVRVVPLIAHVGDKSDKFTQIYALLDSGSDTTLGTMDLANKLGLHGQSCKLTLQGVNDLKKMNALEVSFLVKGTSSGSRSFSLKSVTCIDSLPGHCKSIPSNTITARHSHLRDIHFPMVRSDRIDLIIGADHEHLHKILDSRSSPDSGLHAYLTPLGWVLAGTDDQVTVSSCRTIAASTFHVSTLNSVLFPDYVVDISDQALQAVKDMVHHCPEFPDDEDTAPSVENEQVIKLFDVERSKDKNGHFQLPIPLRDKDEVIPNNRSLAVSRLNSLRSTLRKNPELFGFYASKVNDMKKKGYLGNIRDKAHPPKHVSYLPHFCTHQVKRRIVLDAAASHLGRSLNSYIMEGPDLMEPLVDVLTRFRQDAVAFACDIKEMFHQVKLPPDSVISLRFLWFKEDDLDGEIEELEFFVHVFGVKSSPPAANYAVKQTAKDNKSNASPETVKVMENQLYVDDCLNSEGSVKETLLRITELNALAATSGFQFVKYTSNSKEVLNSLDPDLLLPDLKELNLRQDGLPTHKALGVYWDPSNDSLTFRIQLQPRPVTRRGILSMLSQVFDPLGIALPYLVYGRRIMQKAFICSNSNDWDSPLPAKLQKEWQQWLKHLPQLEKISLSRCYHTKGARPNTYELHTFGDASNVGIAAVTYLRFKKNDSWDCAFVRGKGHILPKGVAWATPRHELDASLMAAKLHVEVLKALELPIVKEILWTDSETVLSWLTNAVRRPKVFVYNRRRDILRITSSEQWRYVNTAHNPSDLATRGLPTRKITSESIWLKGPEFLRRDESEWPTWKPPKVCEENLELLPPSETLVVTVTPCHSNIPLPGEFVSQESPEEKTFAMLWKFSSLSKLLRVTAWLARLSSKVKSYHLTSADLESALLEVVRLAQTEYFTAAILDKIQSKGFINALENCSNKALKEKLRPLSKLVPYVDDQGLLRVQGRLQNSNLPFDTLHPIILPRRHHVTRLIVEDCHTKNNHFGGVQYILNSLRIRFWVSHSSVKFYLDRCLPCLRIRAQTGKQIMAPLPAERVATHEHPFAASGVDYFGPLLVRVKRSSVKRWVALFTCLATRAVHLEVVFNLTTSSFLQAFFRFRNSRGGVVDTLYSDNASTFHGADKELKQAVERLESEGFGNKLLQRGVDWRFNAPLASHQGGVWERQIRSVRKVLLGIPAFQLHAPDDEILITVLKEAECIINNRPLTQIDGEAENIPALTPSMLLSGSLHPAAPVDTFHTSDQLKRDWRYTQIAAEQFWSRFIKEYLVNLQSRPKWHKSFPDLCVGDVVLVKEVKFNHRPNYPKAVVVQLHPGPDGHVRNVQLRFADGRTLVRDIRKIVQLERRDPATTSLAMAAE